MFCFLIFADLARLRILISNVYDFISYDIRRRRSKKNNSGSILGTFVLYDLAIHYTGIGFLGITIALYLPLMLPPITGRIIHFTEFNSLPLFLIIAALAIRTSGDIVLSLQPATIASASYAIMTSGWLIVAALFAFVVMINRSMKQEEVINEQ
jgi:hypothetical protein